MESIVIRIVSFFRFRSVGFAKQNILRKVNELRFGAYSICRIERKGVKRVCRRGEKEKGVNR